MYLNKPFKIFMLLLVAWLLVLAGCQKKLDTKSPDSLPTRKTINNAIEQLLVDRSGNGDTIWLSQSFGTGIDRLQPQFGMSFKDNGSVQVYGMEFTFRNIVQIYADAGSPLIAFLLEQALKDQKVEIKYKTVDRLLRSALNRVVTTPDNTNPLKVLLEGANLLPGMAWTGLVKDLVPFSVNSDEYNSSLTISGQNSLSRAKRYQDADFDFKILSYSRDSIALRAYYTSLPGGRDLTLKPVPFKDYQTYIQAMNMIFKLDSLSSRTHIEVEGQPFWFTNRLGGDTIRNKATKFFKDNCLGSYDTKTNAPVFKLDRWIGIEERDSSNLVPTKYPGYQPMYRYPKQYSALTQEHLVLRPIWVNPDAIPAFGADLVIFKAYIDGDPNWEQNGKTVKLIRNPDVGGNNWALDMIAKNYPITFGNGFAGKAVDGNTNGDYNAGSVAVIQKLTKQNVTRDLLMNSLDSATKAEFLKEVGGELGVDSLINIIHAGKDSLLNVAMGLYFDFMGTSWEVDLGLVRSIDYIKIWHRTDCCNPSFNDTYVIWVSEKPITEKMALLALISNPAPPPGVKSFLISGTRGTSQYVDVFASARYIKIFNPNDMSLAEVEVLHE